MSTCLGQLPAQWYARHGAPRRPFRYLPRPEVIALPKVFMFRLLHLLLADDRTRKDDQL